MLKHKLQAYTSELMHLGLHRKRQITSTTADALILNSNDYLSLTRHPDIKAAYQTGFERYPTGSGGSMLVCGYHAIHKTLEETFSDVLNVDDALLFSSGYAANISLLQLLAKMNASVFVDKSVHASIYDGLERSQISYRRYLHNDLMDLQKKIQAHSVILTESVFSMSGQIAPLADMALLKQDLLVDEAHAFGVLGQNGLGGVAAAQLTQQEVPLRVIPFGKACGTTGAIVAGDEVWIDALLQVAKPYIYSTAMSPALAYGLLKTLEVIQHAHERRETLNQLVRYFRDHIKASSLTWRDSYSLIQQLQVGCPHKALELARYLQTRAIFCTAMRQPTVSKQETGLRIILNYDHQPEDIDYLFKCLNEYTYS